MTVPTRGTKSAGGTSFTSGTTILSSEVNTDLDTLYAKFSADIWNDNIATAADIAETKIADHGTLATVESVGKDGSNLPTTLADEITALRYEIAQLKYGNATDQDATAIPWYGRSPSFLSNPGNLLPNSNFAAFQSPASTTVPDLWSATGTPATQYDHTALAQSDGLGLGSYLKITGAGSTNTGITYTIPAASLRQSTDYVCYAMAWASSGTARMYTSGATTEMDVETTSATPILLQGFFTTTATPAAVQLFLVSKGASDVTEWFGVVCVPTSIKTPRKQGYTALIQRMEDVGTTIANTDTLPAIDAAVAAGTDGVVWDDGTDNLQQTLTVPGPGYAIRVTARLGYTTSSSGVQVVVRLLESTDAGVTYVLRDGVSQAAPTIGSVIPQSTTLQYVDMSPTPGGVYIYRVHASSIGATNIIPQGASSNTKSSLIVELIPTGV